MIHCLSMDARTVESRVWPRWMTAVDNLVSKFAGLDDDAFGYNETASVSLLCSAAARCGYLALAEFTTRKRGPQDKRERQAGRCDMYLFADGRDWEFEFKQFYPWSVPRSRLQKWWNDAVACAKCLERDGADHAVAGLIVNFHNLEVEDHVRARKALTRFAAERRYAWHLEPCHTTVSDTFIFMERV